MEWYEVADNSFSSVGATATNKNSCSNNDGIADQ